MAINTKLASNFKNVGIDNIGDDDCAAMFSCPRSAMLPGHDTYYHHCNLKDSMQATVEMFV